MNIFPIGLATGEAFCNRENERKLLAAHIKNNRHTVLISPRRYGKTSLIAQTLLENKFLSCIIDMTMATSEQEVVKIIILGITPLLNSLLPMGKKIVKNILKIFNFLNPEIALKLAGQSIRLNPDFSQNPNITISETLKKLDELSGCLNKKVVIVLDEFQAIGEFSNHNIEANIRNAMQYSKNICYLFSGSNRHMIQKMFSDKARPFYNSCEILKLNLMSSTSQMNFIQNAAKDKWGEALPDEVVEEILSITELHTNYINKLCGHFWIMDEKPDKESVRLYWAQLVQAESYFLSDKFISLSKNQKKLLYHIANNEVSQPTSTNVCNSIQLSPASARQAYQKLESEDYIAKNAEGIVIFIDPAMKSYVQGLYGARLS